MLLNKVREYRWELWLFFGVPIAAWIVDWAISAVLSPAPYGFDRWFFVWLRLPGSLAWLSVLAVSYFWVRRLKRPLLRLLWQHSLVSMTVGITLYLVVVNLLYEEDLTPLQQSLMNSWVIGISIPMRLMILVWFARRASRRGFNYALAFIVITVFPNQFRAPEVGDWSPEYYFGGLVFGVMLTLIVVQVLHRADLGGGVSGRAIATLFSVAVLGQASSYLLPPAEWFAVLIFGVLVVVLESGIGVVLTYPLRMREIDLDFVAVEHTLMDEGEKPRGDEVDDELVGLYRPRG